MSAVIIDFPKSDAFTVIRYPAGESQVRLNKDYLEPLRLASDIVIAARISNAEDLVRLVLLSDAVYGWTLKEQVLHIPYLPYSRADRRFVYGDCAGLQMFAHILRLGHFSKIVTLDVHSSRAADYIPNLNNETPRVLIDKTVAAIGEAFGEGQILLPDAGSILRYSWSLPWNVLACGKKRNPDTGALDGFVLPHLSNIGDGPLLIIDDICDGGGTFIGIAKELIKAGKKNNLFLYVTHGIFSKGLHVLEPYFMQIYTTNSFEQKPSSALTVYPVMR